MKATQKLHDIGQSLWLDNITRGLLTSGTRRRYRDEFAVRGMTSNSTIFDHAMRHWAAAGVAAPPGARADDRPELWTSR